MLVLIFLFFHSCFSGARKIERFLVLVGLHINEKGDDIRQLDGAFPSRTGTVTAVHALFCCNMCSYIEALFCLFLSRAYRSMVIFSSMFPGTERLGEHQHDQLV